MASRTSPRVRGIVAATAALATALSVASAAPLEAATPSSGTSSGTLTASPAGSGAAVRTRMGSTVFDLPNETTEQAFHRVRKQLGGRLGAVRHFAPGLPQPWSYLRDAYGRTRLVISFRAEPSQVLAGRYDSQLRTWFRQAPRKYLTYWSYMHEPEDDAERGQLALEPYRRAWRHIEQLARSAHNWRLRSTLILMCWTLEKNSHRRWRNYYAGDRVIDVMAFDCYNAGHRNATYRPPRDLLMHANRLSRRINTPWGIAEIGSVVVRGDNGVGRARWLKRAARYARQHNARFVTYFNSDVGTDYRLNDYPSRTAWRRVVENQFR